MLLVVRASKARARMQRRGCTSWAYTRVPASRDDDAPDSRASAPRALPAHVALWRSVALHVSEKTESIPDEREQILYKPAHLKHIYDKGGQSADVREPDRVRFPSFDLATPYEVSGRLWDSIMMEL